MDKCGTILVVDDNLAIHTALKYALENTFSEIISLTQPDAILKTMAQQMVDVVLLDMNFTLGVNTGQDGLLWLRTIKKHHPQMPVVLLTAYADVQLAVKGLKSGAADFIVKPWDNEELVYKLREVLRKSTEVVTLDEVEAEHIRRAVDMSHGNLSKAADMLGISRQTLYNKMKKQS